MSAIGQTNTFLASIVRLGFLGLASVAGWLGWRVWHAEAIHAQEVAQLHQQLESKQREIDRLALANRLLKIDRRVARILVLEQTPAASGKPMTTKVRFEEVDGEGNPIGSPKELTIEGDVLYVDSWVVKFEDVFVEQGDPVRSASLVLFRRLFGEKQAPADGVAIDSAGERPAAYGGHGTMSAVESEVWKDFWEFANDPRRAAALGVRAAHGEAPSMKLKNGGIYTITLRSSGGLTIQPEGAARGSN
jgi:hypothetical protein